MLYRHLDTHDRRSTAKPHRADLKTIEVTLQLPLKGSQRWVKVGFIKAAEEGLLGSDITRTAIAADGHPQDPWSAPLSLCLVDSI